MVQILMVEKTYVHARVRVQIGLFNSTRHGFNPTF